MQEKLDSIFRRINSRTLVFDNFDKILSKKIVGDELQIKLKKNLYREKGGSISDKLTLNFEDENFVLKYPFFFNKLKIVPIENEIRLLDNISNSENINLYNQFWINTVENDDQEKLYIDVSYKTNVINYNEQHNDLKLFSTIELVKSIWKSILYKKESSNKFVITIDSTTQISDTNLAITVEFEESDDFTHVSSKILINENRIQEYKGYLIDLFMHEFGHCLGFNKRVFEEYSSKLNYNSCSNTLMQNNLQPKLEKNEINAHWKESNLRDNYSLMSPYLNWNSFLTAKTLHTFKKLGFKLNIDNANKYNDFLIWRAIQLTNDQDLINKYPHNDFIGSKIDAKDQSKIIKLIERKNSQIRINEKLIKKKQPT